MLSFKRPSPEAIAAFRAAQSRLELTYSPVGATRTGDFPAGFTVDRNRIRLGSGRETFERAVEALRQWRHYEFGWIELIGSEVTEPGETVAVLARVAGLWTLNACRVVYVFEEREPLRRFSFAYGTLPDHAERGEERFQVEWASDDSVWYELLAFSRPQQWSSRLAYPYVRLKQKRFARDSMAALRAALA